jgi:hypothetical protein
MRRSADLLVVTACVVESLSIFALVGDSSARVVPALAMVLFVPGYAVSVLLFPSPTIARLERLLLAVGLSLSTAVVAALVLDRFTRLTARSWADALAAVTAVAVAGGTLRRRAEDTGSGGTPALRIALGPLLVVSLATAVVAASVVTAIAMARHPAGHAQGSTILWARADSRARGTYSVGLESSERHPTRYLLTGTMEGKVVLRRAVALPSRGTWQMTASVDGPPVGPGVLQLSLYEQSAPIVLYRHVALTFGTAGI